MPTTRASAVAVRNRRRAAALVVPDRPVKSPGTGARNSDDEQGGTVDVKALFELPMHIWLMCDALDVSYPIGSGDLRFTVAMPDGRPPVGGPPDVPGIASRTEQAG